MKNCRFIENAFLGNWKKKKKRKTNDRTI